MPQPLDARGRGHLGHNQEVHIQDLSQIFVSTCSFLHFDSVLLGALELEVREGSFPFRYPLARGGESSLIL
jgi:hypothetical protein